MAARSANPETCQVDLRWNVRLAYARSTVLAMHR